MKKSCLLSILLLILGMSARAQESVSVGEVLVPQGHLALLEVQFQFNENHDYVSYQFTVNLPDGISLVNDAYNKPVVVLGDGQPSALYTLDLNATTHNVTCYSNPATLIAANKGVLVRIPVKADANLAVGTELNGSLTGVEFAHANAVSAPFGDANFTIRVTDEIVLDENSPLAPEDVKNVKVRVKRTINANEWSTLCLPFDLTEEQFKDIFGDDVQLAYFVSYDVDKEGDDVLGITVNFEEDDLSQDFTANYPYIIRTTKNITEFTITTSIKTNNVLEVYKSGKKTLGQFIGTYEAGTLVPDQSLFLNGNKFWYSVGNTKIKAFRAYFTFVDVLSSLNGAAVKLYVGNDETGIDEMENVKCKMDNAIYDLSGRHVNKAIKGIYIVNGKKIVVK